MIRRLLDLYARLVYSKVHKDVQAYLNTVGSALYTHKERLADLKARFPAQRDSSVIRNIEQDGIQGEFTWRFAYLSFRELNGEDTVKNWETLKRLVSIRRHAQRAYYKATATLQQ